MSRQPAAIVDSGCLDGTQRVQRISHAMDPGTKIKFGHRTEEKFVELSAALTIAPVADPDHIVGWLDLRQRSIERDIGRFVPSERPVGPAELQIYLPQHLAEGEYAIKAVEIEALQFVGRRHGAMMRVME